MIFNEVIGNINEIDDLNGYNVETIYLNSEDMLKRILRVTSDHNREYGITLDNNEKLKDVPKILETPYIKGTKDSYPPYKFEIEMIKSKKFNDKLYDDVINYHTSL